VQGVKKGDTATQSTCERLLNEDTAIAQSAVRRLVKVPLTQTQYDELVDFTFNVGQGAFAGSTLLKKINAGDCYGAGAEFPKWRYAKGVELRGLAIRREANRKGWESGC
jgi:lysozyme